MTNTKKISIVFDNTTLDPGLKTEWGFACVIELDNEKSLFDTGNDGKILLSNMARLGYAPKDFSRLIISHMHWDHVGGVIDFLHHNSDVIVYMPASSLTDDINMIKSISKSVVLVSEPVEITDGLFSLGDLPGYLNEQSVVLKTDEGLVVLTGCAHPGVLNIVKRARVSFPDVPVKLLIGGFHLLHDSTESVIELIEKLKRLNVQQVAPTHCTGEKQMELCRQLYAGHYIKAGAGLKLQFK
ncbi:MBL fold metallo-hydrolase [candidate division KSB1 bacterium]|nr:MBL fold metallo-hydrolase [candidate division KSB1 bacterium]